MAESRWYDKFEPLYNIGTFGDLFYRQARKNALDELRRSSGSKVLDVFCGTGLDLEPLHRDVGDHGRILAVDGSPGRLKKAKSRNSGIEKVVGYIREKQPRHVLFSLALIISSKCNGLQRSI